MKSPHPLPATREGRELQQVVLWLKVRLAELLCTDWMGRVLARILKDQVPFRGIKIDTRSPEFSDRVKAQLFWRVYESAECRFVRRYLRGAQYAIELGSSLGVVSSHIASVMRDGGRLICVEANPALIPAIGTALDQIKKKKRLGVVVIHAAIVADPTQKEASLLLGSETVGSTIVDVPLSNGASVKVPAMTLSEVVEQSEFPEYVLVSDIEGAEISFILSDTRSLRACRRMVIELHDVESGRNQVQYGELLDVLIASGFQIIDSRGPVVVLEQQLLPLVP